MELLVFLRIYYGSPSNLVKSRDQGQTSGPQFKHPLMVKENWKVGFQEKFHHQSLYDQVLAGRQKTHNNNILTLLNTANTAMLTVRNTSKYVDYRILTWYVDYQILTLQ